MQGPPGLWNPGAAAQAVLGGAGVVFFFLQIHKHPAQLEMRFAVRTIFPPGSLGSVLQPEPRSRPTPAIVF